MVSTLVELGHGDEDLKTFQADFNGLSAKIV